MKVLHIISGIGQESGGTSRAAQGLVAELCKAGGDAWLYSFDGVEPWVEGARRLNVPVFDGLVLAVREFDLVHINGIWDWPLHRVAVMCRKMGVPYVVTPHGMLEPWSLKQKWLKKRIARFLYQDRDLKCAAALHATADSEGAQFRRLGFKNKIILSPNGVSVPEKGTVTGEQGGRRALFVSRMRPNKGALALVEAWARIRQSDAQTIGPWTCELVYTMNSEEERAYEQKVKRRVRELGLEDQFVFTGALDDEQKWEAYGRASLFVLPTQSENFGIVIAEALWAGVPVITTKGAPWQELETEGCGKWIEVGVEPLVGALREMVSLTAEQRSQMGERGHALVARKYTWKSAAEALIKGYEEVLRGRA